jgi:Protein involved in cell division
VRDDYQYIDPDYSYTDPKTGVLRNRENITDVRLLLVFESLKVSARLEEIQANPINIKNLSTLLDIHRHLFQDIYSWAGNIRTVEISKGGKPFFPLSHFNNAFIFIDTLIVEYRKIDRKNKVLLTRKLAEILDNINYLHPFREGNGRTQREFLRLLAMEKGLSLNLNPPDNADVYKRYMSGTINGNVEQLASLISEIVTLD